MTFQANYSGQRRAAIRRAQRAVVALAATPDTQPAMRRQHGIVNDATAYTDRDAWAAVQILEGLACAATQQERGPEHRPPGDATERTGGTASTRRPGTTPNASNQCRSTVDHTDHTRGPAGRRLAGVDLASYALDPSAHPAGSTLEDLAVLARHGNAAAGLLLELSIANPDRRCAVCGQGGEDLRPLFVVDTLTGETPEAAGYGACARCANVVPPYVVARAADRGWRGAPDD